MSSPPSVAEHYLLQKSPSPLSRSYNLPSASGRVNQFLQETSFIVAHKKLPAIYWRNSSQEDWIPFLSLAIRVMSSFTTSPCVAHSFQAFLSTIPTISRQSFDALSTALKGDYMSSVSTGAERETVDAILRAVDAYSEAQTLVNKIEHLKNQTKHVPPRVQVRYAGWQFNDFPTVCAFLQSEMMEMKIVAPANVYVAQIVIQSLKERLPEKVDVEYRKEETGGVIWLKKPFRQEQSRRIQYEMDRDRLERYKTDLDNLKAGVVWL